MLKSTIAITVIALGMKDVKAAWAMLFVISASIAGAIHLYFHHSTGALRAIGNFALIDTVGSVVYILGVAIF